MEFEEWEPVYEAILADFGFDRRVDELARDRLAALTDEFDVSRLHLAGKTVAIAGAGPRLERDRERAAAADAIVAASDAGVRLDAMGLVPDLVVTDLDGDPSGTVELAHRGVPVAVHAHGDNVPALEAHVPKLPDSEVLATTQAAPTGPVRNFGGFTDGDRAAFLADHFGAARLTFPGWELDDPEVEPRKRQKLEWATRLLAWLERRRNERFDVLDGLRDRFDPVISEYAGSDG